MQLRFPILLVFVCLLQALAGHASALVAPHTQTVPGLGTASFPTSAHSPQAQDAFMRGLLLLHLFEYAASARSFQAAEALEPDFAMAYWGEAMTFNHPVWNQLNQKGGEDALARFAATPTARAARVNDARERAYLAAVEILYQSGGTKIVRDARYAEAMHSLSTAYPDDDEARLFYSLALLGKSQGKRDVPVYLEAAKIAQSVYRRNPDHPGAAHYWIHGMDDPEHAAGALVAANALSRIAPDAGHAQHMCSHIFMALGMWNEVVEANENAIRVVDEQDRARGEPTVGCFHYPTWLEYGYFQQGRVRKAEAMVSACQQSARDAVQALSAGNPGAHPGHPTQGGTPESLRRQANASLINMRGIAVVESEDWTGAAALLKIDEAGLQTDSGWDAFTTGFAAARRGEKPVAAAALEQIRAVEHTPDPDRETSNTAYLSVLEDDLAATMAQAAGRLDEAAKDATRAAATYTSQPFDFGPPAVLKPPQELLGEILLARHDGSAAAEAFRASLKLAPNRCRSLLGLARAEALAGDKASSQASYRQLLVIWGGADPDLPALAEARVAVQGSTR